MFAEAARLRKALEIDCYADRQDLSIDLVKVARDHGALISSGTDAHHRGNWSHRVRLAAASQAKIQQNECEFRLSSGFRKLD